MTKYVKLKCFKCGFVTYGESDWRIKWQSNAGPADHCHECNFGEYEEIGSATQYEHDEHWNPPDPIIWSELLPSSNEWLEFFKDIIKIILVVAFWILVIAAIGIFF